MRFRTLLMQHQGKSGRDWSTDDVSQPGYRHIATRVSSAINDGTFRRIPVDLACQILWSAVHGVVTVTLTAEGFAYAERASLVAAAIDNAIRGLMAKDTARPRR